MTVTGNQGTTIQSDQKGAATSLHARRFKSSRAIVALMLRELSTTYGRSPGGYIWTILEPVGGIAMFTLVLTVGLRIRTPDLGISFPLFYATGILPMMMFQRGSRAVGNALRYSSSLLFYPGVTYIDAIAARFLVNLLTVLLICYLIFGGVVLLFETRSVLDFPSIVLSLSLGALLGLGFGCLNAFAFPTFPLWESLWNILTFPLFLLSSIIYTFESLPPVGQAILWYNPIVHIVGIMRRGFYPTYDATWANPLYPFGVSMVVLVFGLALLRGYHRDILNR
jgi:capsular polysaccharide transport system permease protein